MGAQVSAMNEVMPEKKDVEKIENQKQFIALYGSDDSILTVKECDILDEEMKNKIRAAADKAYAELDAQTK